MTYLYSSGGGAASPGAVDSSALPFLPVDLNDGWTLTDLDGLLQGVSVDGSGVHTVTMNAQAGSQDYDWGQHFLQRAPRWVRPLETLDASGNARRITTDDTFVLQLHLERPSGGSDFDSEVILGSSVNGTVAGAAANSILGGAIETVAGDPPSFGVFALSAISASPGGDGGIITLHHAGGRGQGGLYTVTSGGAQGVGGVRQANFAYSPGVPMNLVLGVGTLGAATISAGDSVTFRAGYRVIRFDV